MKKVYYGYWTTGSSYNREGYEFSNLRKAKKTMRAIAKGNNTDSGARWWIQNGLDQYAHDYPIAEGRV